MLSNFISFSLMSKIFNTFNQYNFTVQEDQDFDADVAVDPEMLGKVFENLLPENFKKGKSKYNKKYIDDIGKDEVISFSYEGKELKPGDTLKKTSVIDFKLGNGKL